MNCDVHKNWPCEYIYTIKHNVIDSTIEKHYCERCIKQKLEEQEKFWENMPVTTTLVHIPLPPSIKSTQVTSITSHNRNAGVPPRIHTYTVQPVQVPFSYYRQMKIESMLKILLSPDCPPPLKTKYQTIIEGIDLNHRYTGNDLTVKIAGSLYVITPLAYNELLKLINEIVE